MSFKKIECSINTYNFADLHSLVWKYVLLDPRRMVPPICVFDPYSKKSKQIKSKKKYTFFNLFSQHQNKIKQIDTSGINMMYGLLVWGSNSVLLASCTPRTDRANSMTAICIPRQMPRNGILFSRAYLAAIIFPCTPLSPNPPGTRTPSAPCRQRLVR